MFFAAAVTLPFFPKWHRLVFISAAGEIPPAG
jgi:hypothetical protein